MFRLITDAGNKKERPQHPRSYANIFEILTFSWILKLFKRLHHRDFEEKDLYATLHDHSSSSLGNALEEIWRLEVESAHKVNRDPSLLRTLIKLFGLRYMFYGFALFFNEIVFKISQPLFIGGLFEHFNTHDSNKTDIRNVYICASGLVFCMFTSILLQQLNHLEIIHCGMKLRVACCSIIYRKALHLSHAAFGKTTVGHVINLLSNDMNRFDTALVFIHYLWIGPLQTIVVAYFLWQEIGVSSIIGISTFIIFIPLQGYFGKKISELRLKTVNMTDERIRLMNEIISGIQLIKMYTWEKPFVKLIEYTRKKEIQYVKMSSYLKSTLSALAIIQTKVQLFIIIISYVLLGNVISIKKVFIVIAFFNLLGYSITTIFCQGSAQVAELLVSIGRIQKFLLLEEKDRVKSISYLPGNALNDNENESTVHKGQYVENNISLDKSNEELKTFGVLVSNATAKWTRIHTNNSIENINLTVVPGQLVAIVGPVGAGKSSLLHAILRELPLSEGKITVSGAISYASQEPWIFSGSIQQNIIFDSPMDNERYKQVINVCALKSDIEQFPCGDRMIVGEKGVTLSGGQRARINLARAVYKKADIYLLDDPLSAVDTKVGNHLFEKCIKDFLKPKTCILITHQVQYLANVDQIVIMNNANILLVGSYKEVLATNIDFVSFLKSPEDVRMTTFTEKNNRNNDDLNINAYSSNENIASSIEKLNDITAETNEEPKEPESRSSGHVSKKVYFTYLSAGGSTFKVLFLFSIYFITRALYIGGDFWIHIWVTQEEYYFQNTSNITFMAQGSYDTLMPSSNIRQVFVVIYTLFVIALIVAALISSATFTSISTSSSINLHNMMLNSIIRATMYFFNTNSSGRILNRFSKDLGAVDVILPTILSDFISFSMDVLEIFIVVVLINIYLTLPTFIIGVLFYFILVFYSKTSQIIKRLEGVTRSPIFSHMSESVQGLTTIRAYNAEKILINEFDKHQDLHSSAWYSFMSVNTAFAFWIDLICLFFISTVIFSFLFIGNSVNNMYSGLFGLALIHTMRLLGIVQTGIRRLVTLEHQMTSVERVIEYINSPQEVTIQYHPSDNIKNTIPPKEWPDFGEIIFKKINLRYNSNGSYVLKNLSFRIQPMEKIGIVGRTGAGKSSIVRALFRLASIEGNIFVDGIDIHELGLHDLRSKFSIIPQEPVLFSGTMRTNLDPFDEYPDHVLWNALSQVELKVSIESLPGGLNSEMSENGSNFSVGQRQLVCLARAIVRNNKILVLDEATANVDSQTDALIQKSIRNVFQKCTVITIAHRLNTIMDSDKVLVMDTGRMVEFDHPHNLLKNQNGVLYSMVKETGPHSADSLHIVAAESFKNRRMRQESPVNKCTGNREQYNKL